MGAAGCLHTDSDAGQIMAQIQMSQAQGLPPPHAARVGPGTTGTDRRKHARRARHTGREANGTRVSQRPLAHYHTCTHAVTKRSVHMNMRRTALRGGLLR